MTCNNKKIICYSILLIAIGFIGSNIGIRINETKSLPYKVFFSTKIRKRSVGRGAYISFEHPAFDYPIVKQIIGITGDKVESRNNHIYVNGVDRGVVMDYSKNLKIKLFPLLSKQEHFIIPEGYLYLHAGAKSSLDSRYKMIGLIHISQIKERLWPLF